jgi:hypothetical protein
MNKLFIISPKEYNQMLKLANKLARIETIEQKEDNDFVIKRINFHINNMLEGGTTFILNI